MTTPISEHARYGILIVAHGERGGKRDNAHLMQLASEVRALLQDVEVAVGVLKGSPSIAQGWAQLTAPNRFIYPFFMSDGYFCNHILPKKVMEAIRPHTGFGNDRNYPELTILPPFGVSEGLAAAVADVLQKEQEALGRADTRPPVLIAAHGTPVDRQSSTRAHELAEALRITGHFGPVSCGFLDEAPFLCDLVGHISPDTLVLPHFNGLGSHSVDDMAQLAKKAPDGCHFILPVGAQPWVGDVISADIRNALSWNAIAEAAE